MRILVTGSTGFVGTSLVKRLAKDRFSVVSAVRNSLIFEASSGVSLVSTGDLSSTFDWTHALQGVDVVIHLAARTHVLDDRANNPLAEYRYINVDCSLNLARQAACAGVRRFIYLSSIKVNGEFTNSGRPFTAEDTPSPQDFYGVSKYEAELGLRAIADDAEMGLVIIRPPLVYGPGVKGNFLSLMKWISQSIPLPFGAIANQRSLVALENLVDLIVTCIDHSCAPNQIFLASDGQDISTADLCIRLGHALKRPTRLISVPVSWLYFFSTVFGRRGVAERLCSSLQIDISKTESILGWSPKTTVNKSLSETALDFLNK